MKKVRLVDILEEWLKGHKLSRYYNVYRFKDWEFGVHGGWPDELENATAFIGMTCDGIGLGLAIMDDHVYYKLTDKSRRVKFMASDPDFFKKVARDLTTLHRKTHKKGDCNISV